MNAPLRHFVGLAVVAVAVDLQGCATRSLSEPPAAAALAPSSPPAPIAPVAQVLSDDVPLPGESAPLPDPSLAPTHHHHGSGHEH